MPEYVLKYADSRGTVHQQIEQASSEQEVRRKYAEQGYLVYWVKPREGLLAQGVGGGRKKLNLERFIIFNQQFVTLIRAGLPILKALDLLSDKITDRRLATYIRNVRDEVRSGALLSEAFRRQGVFPPIYVTSVLAGERSGSLAEVLERYISYQKLILGVRKKLAVSLLYPSLLLFLVLGLLVFLVTYVVPRFAALYSSMAAELPAVTQLLIAVSIEGRPYVVGLFAGLVVAVVSFRWWARREGAGEKVDRIKFRMPILGPIWTMYQVAQFSRLLSTLLVGGIPLVQALETASESLPPGLMKRAIEQTRKMVREGQSLSAAMAATGVFPRLAVDMAEVGESTGALPAMLNSVAEFFEEDVNIRTTAALSLIEPAIMIFMGIFVAFILIALYSPIFSLAEALR